MGKKIQTPHDLFFRKVMKELYIARDFFGNHLPKNILDKIDLATLRLQPGSYIDSELKEQISDILYSVEFQNQSGATAYLYLLAEHQSSPDRSMPFRLLKYSFGAMEAHLKKYKVLPIVYPLVLYHGAKPYNYSRDLFDLFGEQKELARGLMFQPFQLIDLSKMSDDQMEKHYRSGIMEMLMKHIGARDIANQLKVVLKRLDALNDQDECDYINSVLTYIVNASKISLSDVIDIAKQSPSAEGYMKTVAEQLREEGKLEGKLEGIEEGKHSVAAKMHNLGFPADVIERATGVSVERLLHL